MAIRLSTCLFVVSLVVRLADVERLFRQQQSTLNFATICTKKSLSRLSRAGIWFHLNRFFGTKWHNLMIWCNLKRFLGTKRLAKYISFRKNVLSRTKYETLPVSGITSSLPKEISYSPPQKSGSILVLSAHSMSGTQNEVSWRNHTSVPYSYHATNSDYSPASLTSTSVISVPYP